MKLHITGSPALIPNIVYSCPGETVTFSCSSVMNYGERLWWSVNYSDPHWSDVTRQRISSTEQQDHTHINNAGHKFLFTLESNNSNSLTSSAVTNITHNMNGTLVTCRDTSNTVATSVIHLSNGIYEFSMLYRL